MAQMKDVIATKLVLRNVPIELLLNLFPCPTCVSLCCNNKKITSRSNGHGPPKSKNIPYKPKKTVVDLIENSSKDTNRT